MNVSTEQARKYVLISVIGLIAIAAYKGNLSDSQVSFAKRLWGTGVLAIMLGLVADVAPTVAGPFAILVLVGSFTKGGDKAIQNLLGKVSGGPVAVGGGREPARTTITDTKSKVHNPTHPGQNP